MNEIRENNSIILGITGHLGSGSTTLAKHLAFTFDQSINNVLKMDNSAEIIGFYHKLDDYQKSMEKDIYKLAEIKRELYKALEQREIKRVIKRHEKELKNNKFYYISFSSLIVYFIIRNIKGHIDGLSGDIQAIAKTVESVLSGIGMDLKKANSLIKYFDRITKDIASGNKKLKKSSKGKNIVISYPGIERILELFSKFDLIRDAIIKDFGYKILQNYGDNIRITGNPFQGEGYKMKRTNYIKARFIALVADKYIALLQRRGFQYFVVESFRNPQELFYFREKYSYFYLFALDVIGEERKKRSNISGYDEIVNRESGDREEGVLKLNVPRCMDLADVVVKNDATIDDLKYKIIRYFALILEPGCVKPNQTESLMHIAYTLSDRSYCISRQVGAVITNTDGYIIGAGWNDVGQGQISCGLKNVDDYRSVEYLRDDKIILNDLANTDYVCFKDEYDKKNIDKGGRLLNCVALHAEENAILQLARYHSQAISGGTIYSTAYPCPLCLLKISQVGISRIVFDQTYSNPISIKILEQNTSDILIERFEGVKYFSFFKLFKPYYDRKEQQKIFRE
jgi:dCMP deaminase